MKNILENPIFLKADNFTPLSRTPWAGRNIGKLYKNGLVDGVNGKAIGESWEFSCDPDFPSYLSDGQTTVEQLLQEYAEDILSPALLKKVGPRCEILLKLLNADSPLSLQVHPKDGDAALKANECGKPESWLVVHAEPGSGLYIGFSKKTPADRLEKALVEGSEAKSLLQFVEVQAGDYFEIEPGVPHAIGPGVTLLEPQRILFGQSGKTYRMWDWGRRYDAQGKEDPKGQGRELHLKDALVLVDSETQVGEEFVASTRRKAELSHVGASTLSTFPKNPYYQVHQLDVIESSVHSLNIESGYGVLTILGGEFTLSGKSSSQVAKRGQTVLLPHSAMPVKMEGKGQVTLVHPAFSSFILA